MHNCNQFKLVSGIALVGVLAIILGVGCATSGGGGGSGADTGSNDNENANATENTNDNGSVNENANTNDNASTNENQNTSENENANDNGTDDNQNTNDNDNDNSNESGLSPEVSAATDLVELELEAYARGLASFMDGLDPKADVDEGEMAIYGSCPMATAGGGENGVVIILNYGDECTNDRYGSAKLSGTATVTVLGQIWGAVVPDFTIDGTTIVGGANCNRLADREAGATLQGNITFTSEGIGQGLGPATVSFDLDTSVITISEAEITLKNTTGVTDTPDTIRYDVIFDNVVIDPVGNGNFTPQSGNVSFVGPGDSGTIVVTYSSESPDSGVVEVTVGDAEAVDYVVTGLN